MRLVLVRNHVTCVERNVVESQAQHMVKTWPHKYEILKTGNEPIKRNGRKKSRKIN